MSHSQPLPGEPGYNPSDPHGFHAGDDHGHHVSSMKLLITVLALLMFFTLLTVLTAQFEVWISSFWGIHIPTWVNVVVAMAIATVKALLVCAYFMHLRHDSLINTYAMLYCLLAMALFLFFSMIDLQNRDTIYPFKQDQIVAGGSGVGMDTNNMAITEFAREKYIGKYGEDAYNKKLAEKHAGHYGHGGSHAPEWSTASQHVQRTGLSGALSLEESHDDGHGGGYGKDHAEDGHGEDGQGDDGQGEAESKSVDPTAEDPAYD